MLDSRELKDLEVFKELDDQQVASLAAIAEIKTFRKGDIVYERTQCAGHVWVVLRGAVSLRRFDPGDAIGLAFETRKRGQLFGAACLVQAGEYTLTAVCLEDSDLLALNEVKLRELFEKDARFGYRFMTKVAQIYFERYRIAKMQLFDMLKAARVTTAVPG